jgi:hypothetical protein
MPTIRRFVFLLEKSCFHAAGSLLDGKHLYLYSCKKRPLRAEDIVLSRISFSRFFVFHYSFIVIQLLKTQRAATGNWIWLVSAAAASGAYSLPAQQQHARIPKSFSRLYFS